MHLLRNPDDPRRRLLVKLLAAGAFSAPTLQALAQVLGGRPAKMPADRSIFRMSGQVSVNGTPASMTVPDTEHGALHRRAGCFVEALTVHEILYTLKQGVKLRRAAPANGGGPRACVQEAQGARQPCIEVRCRVLGPGLQQGCAALRGDRRAPSTRLGRQEMGSSDPSHEFAQGFHAPGRSR